MDPATLIAGIAGPVAGIFDDFVSTPEEEAAAETARLQAEAQLAAAQGASSAAASQASAITGAAKWGALALLGIGIVALVVIRRR